MKTGEKAGSESKVETKSNLLELSINQIDDYRSTAERIVIANKFAG